nr:ABC transporter permease [uncultured Lachnoclostridium sp.]
MSGKIIFTLLKKDLKGCLTNKNILVSFLIPIVFCFIYQNVFSDLGDEAGAYVLGMCAVFSIAISPTSILPVMIAEEKEKYTLRSLMMARVRGQEFLASKLLVCLLMTLLDAAAVFFITGGDMKDFPVYTGAVLLASAGLCFLGALAGLLARDQASAGTIGAPLMLLTMLPPLFGGLNETLEKVSVAVPNTSFQTIYNGVTQDQELLAKNNLIALGVCALWIGAGYILFNLFYQRKGIDC